jgi:hypothetical protein
VGARARRPVYKCCLLRKTKNLIKLQQINHFRHNFSINCIGFVSKWSIIVESEQ